MSSLQNHNLNSNVDLSPKHLKADLLKVLTEIESEKYPQFAVGAITTDLPSIPGIIINGYGNISLPVIDGTINDLKKHFQREEPLVDKAERDFWQLDAEQFKITNEKFTTGVEKLVMEIKEKLGCANVNITHHLRKLLLYEPGGHFKHQQDTAEKLPGMFATLIIQLPSIFSGGDLVVSHKSKEKRIKFSTKESEFFCFYAAHYADCEHELTEIKSGYRMALVYSLCWDGNGVVPSPPEHPPNRLARILQHFNKVAPYGMLAWGLDPQYSENSFLDKGVEALAGSDKMIYSNLQAANDLLNDEKKLDFLIVDAKRQEDVPGCCRYHCECETEYEYDVIGVDGKKWKANGFEIVELYEDVLNIGNDEDEFWGACNEGECTRQDVYYGDISYKTNRYQRYVLLIFPKGCAIKVAFCGEYIHDDAIEYLEDLLETSEDTASVIKVASDIIDLFADDKRLLDSTAIFELLLKLKDLELVKKLLILISEALDSKRHGKFPNEEMISQLKDLVAMFGWEVLATPLTKLIQSSDIQQLTILTKFIEECPKEVPADDLIVSVVEKGVKLMSDPERSHLHTEDIKELGIYIVSHPKICSQFKEVYMNSLGLMKLQGLTRMVSLVRWSCDDDKDHNDEFCQMIVVTFCGKVHKISQEGQEISYDDSRYIADGVTDLYIMKQEDKFKNVVDDVVQIRSAYLLNILVSSYHFNYMKELTEPVKRLMQARVDQLLPIVKAGEPKTDWRRRKAVFPGHPEVQAFMRGPEKTFRYKKFNDRRLAHKFERDYFTKMNDVVLRITGSWETTVVQITKLSKYKENCEQLKTLQAKLGVASA